ncbi:hypothetical protein LX64_00894 [Chitinophaga skermanii]|uniref:L-lysine 6-oxidase n=1 Tax=Chitinophaga skermanii TaxID=331697 RepID=A0A327R2Y5_9BACT|nr:LodA/GoxA family CTQ-dependent oxidase [Chitinophaga skermanii]RAJ08247.1 hypothetical protein LX64_00894 [Chitinophaga skermanii]
MATKNAISSVEIYPPLGIARVGNSNEIFFASDVPGVAPSNTNGYKDAKGRIKKQVPRFRIYGLDAQGKVVQELTAGADVTIEWRVNIANRKAGWYQFMNALDLPGNQSIPSEHRNLEEPDRTQLVIEPAPQKISGINQQGVMFNDGKFFGKSVPLGEIRTDEAGRLLVVPADGTSGSKEPGAKPTTFANNDGWHDDVADGTIYATVTIGGTKYDAAPAMVAITPPNYGQGLFAVVTMYDVVEDLFISTGEIKQPTQVEFWKHIYPILERTVQTQWVNHGFFMVFGQNSPSDFTTPEMIDKLKTPAPHNAEFRQRVLDWYRSPSSLSYEPTKAPPFYGDAFGEYEKVHNVDLPLTAAQYARMEKWAQGEFIEGTPRATDFDALSPEEQVKYLIEAPLEECLGGPFHPGIEITWPFRQRIFWDAKPFRLKILPENEAPLDNYGPVLTPAIALGPNGPLDGSGPGSLTRWLGVPWQTDEASCLSGYERTTYLSLPSFWAARVPNQVLSAASWERLTDSNLNLPQRLKHFDYRQDWLRDFGTQYLPKINQMVHEWHLLGISTEMEMPAGSEIEGLPKKLWVEAGRAGSEAEDPSFQQVLYAEHATPPALQTSRMMLADAIGVHPEQLQVRKRRVLARDEM